MYETIIMQLTARSSLVFLCWSIW